MTEEDEAFNEIEKRSKVKQTLIEALAKQEQGEPVKIVQYNCTCGKTMKFESEHGIVAQQRTWVGLTFDEIDLLEELYAPPVHPDFVNDADHCLELIRHVEAKLKEKNT